MADKPCSSHVSVALFAQYTSVSDTPGDETTVVSTTSPEHSADPKRLRTKDFAEVYKRYILTCSCCCSRSCESMLKYSESCVVRTVCFIQGTPELVKLSYFCFKRRAFSHVTNALEMEGIDMKPCQKCQQYQECSLFPRKYSLNNNNNAPTQMVSFERGELPLSTDINFSFIARSVHNLCTLVCIIYA